MKVRIYWSSGKTTDVNCYDSREAAHIISINASLGIRAEEIKENIKNYNDELKTPIL